MLNNISTNIFLTITVYALNVVVYMNDNVNMKYLLPRDMCGVLGVFQWRYAAETSTLH